MKTILAIMPIVIVITGVLSLIIYNILREIGILGLILTVGVIAFAFWPIWGIIYFAQQ